MLEYIKSRLPPRLKQAVRKRAFEPIKRELDDRRLVHLVQQLRAASAPSRKLLEAIGRAWGNEGFAADIEYIEETALRVAQCRGPVLECGTGVTTIIAGVMAEKCGIEVWCLEQDAQWLEFVERRLSRSVVRNVHVLYAPLRQYGDYAWYDIDSLTLPRCFAVALCDGPAVFEANCGAAHLQWRYGLLPVLVKAGIDVGEIMMDDANETRAPAMLERWGKEFAMEHQISRSERGDTAIVRRRR